MSLRNSQSRRSSSIAERNVLSPQHQSDIEYDLRIRVLWDRGNDETVDICSSMIINDLKKTLGIFDESFCVLNGRYFLKEHDKSAGNYNLKSGNILSFWSAIGRHVVAAREESSGEELTIHDVPSVVWCDIRFSVLPRLCLSEILRGTLRSYSPKEWLDSRMLSKKHTGIVDGFEHRLEDFYIAIIAHQPTLSQIKKTFANYIGTLIKSSSKHPYIHYEEATLEKLIYWVELVRNTDHPWARSRSNRGRDRRTVRSTSQQLQYPTSPRKTEARRSKDHFRQERNQYHDEHKRSHSLQNLRGKRQESKNPPTKQLPRDLEVSKPGEKKIVTSDSIKKNDAPKKDSTPSKSKDICYIFVDYSNSCKLDIGHFCKTVLKDRVAVEKMVGGSTNKDWDPTIYQDWTRHGYKMYVEGKGRKDGTAFVDDMLHANIFRSLLFAKEKSATLILVLTTGDGDSINGRTSFIDCINAALEKEWKVEVWSFKSLFNAKMISLANDNQQRMKICLLDPLAKKYTMRFPGGLKSADAAAKNKFLKIHKHNVANARLQHFRSQNGMVPNAIMLQNAIMPPNSIMHRNAMMRPHLYNPHIQRYVNPVRKNAIMRGVHKWNKPLLMSNTLKRKSTALI